MHYTAFFVVLALATAWKLYQLSRAPDNRPLRWLTLCLACAATSMAVPDGRQSIDATLGAGAAKLLIIALTLGMTYCLMVFYLCSADDGPATHRRIRVEGLALLGLTGLLVLDAITVPDHAVLHSSFESADMTIPRVAAFYGCIGLYMLYTLAVSGRRTYRYARISSGPEAAGLWLATAGLLGLGLATGWRTAFVVVRAFGGAVPQWLSIGSGALLVASTPVFVLGVTWPGARSRLAAGRLWLHHRRTYHHLEPLWRLLSSAYPDTVLPHTHGRGPAVHRRYARRVVECRDGLVRISPHLGADGPVPQPLATADLAVRLQRAAAAVRSGHTGPQPGTPLAVPHSSGREAEVQQLVALSRALQALPDGAA
ncbi:MAB_1171c family putative transporter [Streptomyces lasiicapitis]|uniref:MAB_1171c family putative transporter n=1 Tax=Streptomyces lasiicapitis TaxID=1923961 RepID=UPI00332E8464